MRRRHIPAWFRRNEGVAEQESRPRVDSSASENPLPSNDLQGNRWQTVGHPRTPRQQTEAQATSQPQIRRVPSRLSD